MTAEARAGRSAQGGGGPVPGGRPVSVEQAGCDGGARGKRRLGRAGVSEHDGGAGNGARERWAGEA
ncbi:hypothetical protein LBW89_15895 [Paenibacillus sp. alder61]|uniref:hypothetical protein n=1 Tax=Paenibacillus sp. alder61 TaxID=2862948 RepID=UPI001CD79A9B|nr:hypothetical protein [Paenibacillus sp. alder61]MCA1294506.1 hypothetical protein [Paenibacillus sp. alder61]